MIIESNQAERDAVLNAAKLMVTAARTAPKINPIIPSTTTEAMTVTIIL